MRVKIWFDVSDHGYGHCSEVLSNLHPQNTPFPIPVGYKRYLIEIEIPDPIPFEKIENAKVTEVKE